MHAICLHVESYIRHMKEVVREVFLYQEALIAAAYDELVHTVVGIHLHNVP